MYIQIYMATGETKRRVASGGGQNVGLQSGLNHHGISWDFSIWFGLGCTEFRILEFAGHGSRSRDIPGL